MRLGSAISVPAPNSAHLRREKGPKLPPFRSESINSGSSSSFVKEIVETESRLNPDEVSFFRSLNREISTLLKKLEIFELLLRRFQR